MCIFYLLSTLSINYKPQSITTLNNTSIPFNCILIHPTIQLSIHPTFHLLNSHYHTSLSNPPLSSHSSSNTSTPRPQSAARSSSEWTLSSATPLSPLWTHRPTQMSSRYPRLSNGLSFPLGGCMCSGCTPDRSLPPSSLSPMTPYGCQFLARLFMYPVTLGFTGSATCLLAVFLCSDSLQGSCAALYKPRTVHECNQPPSCVFPLSQLESRW